VGRHRRSTVGTDLQGRHRTMGQALEASERERWCAVWLWRGSFCYQLPVTASEQSGTRRTMNGQNEKWNAEGMRSDRSNPEPSTPTRAARSSGHVGDKFEYGRPARASVNLLAFAALLVEVIAFIILIPIQTTARAAGSAVRRTNPLDSPRREGESVEAKPVGDIGAGVGVDQTCEEGPPPALTRRERFGLGVALLLKCRQLDYVKNLLASPPRPNLSSDDQEALARYRRVFDTFGGEITFVTAALDETRKGWGSDDPLMGGLSDEDLRRAVETAGTLMKALWPT
jgi:hypothetical protein